MSISTEATILLLGMLLAVGGPACDRQTAVAPSATATGSRVDAPAPPPVEGSRRRLLPVDEAAKDPSFVRFREELLAAVERRDAAYVVSILDPHVLNSFGGNGGIEEFKEHWKLAEPESELWPTLRAVLSMGGTFSPKTPGTFWAPYVFLQFPEDLDAFEHAAVIDESVPLRSRPDAGSEPVAMLSYDIVKVHQDDPAYTYGENGPPAWYKVSTLDGRKGFVPSESVRYATDYRASFEKNRDGEWRMTSLVAGD